MSCYEGSLRAPKQARSQYDDSHDAYGVEDCAGGSEAAERPLGDSRSRMADERCGTSSASCNVQVQAGRQVGR